MGECMDVLESMYKDEAGSLSEQAPRVLTRIDDASIILTMPGYSKILGRFAVKLVSEYKKNPERYGRKVQGGLVILMDSRSSENLALIDSRALTAVRTGALSGLATKLLSRKDSRKVAVIGSGQQAKTMLEAVCVAREIEEARVYSREYAHAKEFARQMEEQLKLPVKAAQERRELQAKTSNIILVATNSSTPVLSWREDVHEGVHINSIGTLPERLELDLDTVCNSRLFVDTKEGVLREAGDIMNAIKTKRINETHILGDLADVLLGKVEGRKSDTEVTLFKSVGFALLDVYAANAVYERTTRN